MKFSPVQFAGKSPLFLTLFVATLTHGKVATNTPNTPFRHVIVVIQENRTPDNLFGSDAFTSPHQLPGADLVTSGKCSTSVAPITLRPLTLGDACDPNHGHKGGWLPTYNGGAMNGACTITPATCDGGTITDPQYTYVEGSDVIPYFQIAEQYGYANYMFQTNQGPSFPAHQFLLSGTSAPVFDDGDTNQYWTWFAAENSSVQGGSYGCTATTTVIKEVNPSGVESNGYQNGYPCYNHNTLVNLLTNPTGTNTTPLTWKYYSQGGPAGLWTAPNAISSICGLSGGSCMGTQWVNNVESVFPDSTSYPKSFSPILTDLGADPNQPQCKLPNVSWVIPDGSWSDHGGEDPHGAGPSWVAAIVNAVGGYDNAGNPLATQCFDNVNGKTVPYWQDTAILILWDDWGGWYDSVLPWRCDSSGTCKGYQNGTGGVGGEYVYGFRVPLLVVSAYSKQGYISGALPSPGKVQPYIHDFGSILNFIEYAFGQIGGTLGYVYPTYQYADYYAPDGPNTCSPSVCPYSLSDFFAGFSNANPFTPFTQGINYQTECFITPKIKSCFGSGFAPSDPDGD
jgi:phospholipase C